MFNLANYAQLRICFWFVSFFGGNEKKIALKKRPEGREDCVMLLFLERGAMMFFQRRNFGVFQALGATCFHLPHGKLASSEAFGVV